MSYMAMLGGCGKQTNKTLRNKITCIGVDSKPKVSVFLKVGTPLSSFKFYKHIKYNKIDHSNMLSVSVHYLFTLLFRDHIFYIFFFLTLKCLPILSLFRQRNRENYSSRGHHRTRNLKIIYLLFSSGSPFSSWESPVELTRYIKQMKM